jgi:hypothetical protein
MIALKHRARMYVFMEVKVHASLISALDGAESSASHSGCFTRGQKAHRFAG